MRRLIFGLAALVLLAGPARAQPGRAALVVGEGAYRTAGAAEFSVADAHRVADALTAAGWRVQAAYDVDRAGLVGAVERFAGHLQPDDAALVYFSGLSAKGQAADRAQGLENYLLPVEAAPASVEALPASGLALSSLLTALTRAGAKAQVVVIDAARPSSLESRWGARPGLAEPTTSALTTNAYLVFPAQPGQIAREGQFAPELARMLAQPGLSAGQGFTDLSALIDRTTGGGQIPWFSGAGASARIPLGPMGGAATAGAGGDGQRYREALACGTQACLAAAAAAVADPRVKMDLMLRAEVATVEDLPKPAPARPVAAAPADYVDSFVEANRGSAAGMSRLGKNYLNGEGGFPKDVNQAYSWLARAATAGDADGAYLFAVFFDRGAAPVGHVDREAAAQYFQKAAQLGQPNAEYEVGRYYFYGYGGLAKDPDQSRAWMEKAAAAGVPKAKDVVAGRTAP